uniref:Uncharacterized protein n=1 Tax=Ditylenchus dipsaci TaxID=166011 RepID=A0A915DF44_9BILA
MEAPSSCYLSEETLFIIRRQLHAEVLPSKVQSAGLSVLHWNWWGDFVGAPCYRWLVCCVVLLLNKTPRPSKREDLVDVEKQGLLLGISF